MLRLFLLFGIVTITSSVFAKGGYLYSVYPDDTVTQELSSSLEEGERCINYYEKEAEGEKEQLSVSISIRRRQAAEKRTKEDGFTSAIYYPSTVDDATDAPIWLTTAKDDITPYLDSESARDASTLRVGGFEYYVDEMGNCLRIFHSGHETGLSIVIDSFKEEIHIHADGTAKLFRNIENDEPDVDEPYLTYDSKLAMPEQTKHADTCYGAHNIEPVWFSTAIQHIIDGDRLAQNL